VLPRLRLDGFVGGDDEQDQVNAPDTREHVTDKPLMAGNVNEAVAQYFTTGSVEFKVSEAEIDGDAATLLFFQTIGINAGQRFHQRGFTVIDVAGRADDYRFHSFLSLRSEPLESFQIGYVVGRSLQQARRANGRSLLHSADGSG
jgi:hypothetical protein